MNPCCWEGYCSLLFPPATPWSWGSTLFWADTVPLPKTMLPELQRHSQRFHRHLHHEQLAPILIACQKNIYNHEWDLKPSYYNRVSDQTCWKAAAWRHRYCGNRLITLDQKPPVNICPLKPPNTAPNAWLHYLLFSTWRPIIPATIRHLTTFNILWGSSKKIDFKF